MKFNVCSKVMGSTEIVCKLCKSRKGAAKDYKNGHSGTRKKNPTKIKAFRPRARSVSYLDEKE